MTIVPGMSVERSAILLDFRHITDPVRLFHTLVLFRHHHEFLYVADENLTVELEYPKHTPTEEGSYVGFYGERFDLAKSRSLLPWLGNYQDVDDLTLSKANFPLAVRILQYAVSEGHIRVISKGFAPSSVKIPPELESFPEVNYSGELLVSRENPVAAGIDLRLTLAHNLSYVTVDASLIDSYGMAEVLHLSLTETKQGIFKQALKRWQPSEFKSFIAAIDHPTVLHELAVEVEEVIESNNLHEDLLLFAPRFVADLFTGGLASVVEMLYRIYRRPK